MIAGNLPAFRQVSLAVCSYPFILLHGEWHCESKVSCPRAEQNDPTRVEPGSLDTESNALTTRPPRPQLKASKTILHIKIKEEQHNVIVR